MEDQLKAFLDYMLAERNYSPLTIELYRREIAAFGEYVKREGCKSWGEVDRNLMRRYLGWLSAQGYAKGSIARRMAEVRSFYKFLQRQGYLATNPLTNMSSPKTDKRLPEFLSVEETVALLSVPDTTTPHGLRDRAILELLYASGMRVSEIVGLNLGDVDMHRGEARVMGKGSKERIVLLGQPALRALAAYLREGRHKLLGQKSSDALFLNRFGQRFSARGIQRLLDEASQMAGIPRRITPHTLRHTFATHMLDGGADLRVVQELLGHANLSTTQKYTHVTQSRARKVYLSTHPLAKRACGKQINDQLQPGEGK